MIDPNAFRVEWAVLCERWNRKPSTDLTARYFQYLMARMDTDQFRAAATAILASREFFPSPEDFVTAVRPAPQEEAVAQWDLCQRIMEGEAHLLDRMSPEGQRVVGVLGGVGRLRQTPLDSLPFVRKEFLGLYSDVARAAEHEGRLLGQEMSPESRRLVGQVMRENRDGPALLAEPKEGSG